MLYDNDEERRFVQVHWIPSTAHTPDIYYPDDRESAVVAEISYLTLLLLDAPIQRLVNAPLRSLVCAFSPMRGGRSIEQEVAKPGKVLPVVPYIQSRYVKGSKERRLERSAIGWCNGDWISAYAYSDKKDRQHCLTQSWWRANPQLGVSQHRPPMHKLALRVLAFAQHAHDGSEQDIVDRLRTVIDQQHDDQYGVVPLTLCHEFGHLVGDQLMRRVNYHFGIDRAVYQTDINREISRVRNSMKGDLSYYRDPAEAHAELFGATLIMRLNQRFGLNLPTDGLEDMLPQSFEDMRRAVTSYCEKYKAPQKQLTRYQPFELAG
jgi:hypothetical protein